MRRRHPLIYQAAAGAAAKKKGAPDWVRPGDRGRRGSFAYQPTAPARLVCLAIDFSSSQTVRPVLVCTSDIWNE